MRIAAIATDNPANRHLLLRLAGEHDLVGIFHPGLASRGPRGKIASLRKWRRLYGGWHVALHKLAEGRRSVGWNGPLRLAQAQADRFARDAGRFEATLAAKAETVPDVNAPAFVERLQALDPDVVICSGGPVYRAPLIRACRLILNYHTGISPLYNGAETNWWAFANGHPHLCGGTLMVMSEAVDGGDILAHHFTGAEPQDDPADLFCKAIVGGAELYSAFLGTLAAGRPYSAVPQPRPFFYMRGWDWTIADALRVDRRLRIAMRDQRRLAPREARYWTEPDRAAATRAFEAEILRSVLHAQ